MISRLLKIYPFREVGFMIAGITVVLGSILSAAGVGVWYIQYLYTFVYTTSCSIFISIPLCLLYERLWRIPRTLYYVSFAVIVLLGAFIGTQAAHAALYRSLFVNRPVLLITLLMSFITTSVIVAYRHIQANLEHKISRIREVELENEKLKRYELEARLNSLQTKLNPHFLFNTLNSLAALVYDDPTRAERSIVRLSELYRRVLSVSEKGVTTVADEIALIEDYLELEMQRLDERLIYRLACPEELKDRKIPGLLIEPLVENAIKHNTTDRLLEIDLEIGEFDGTLLIEVRDNGRGFDPAKTSFGFGLYGIQQRLALMYEDRYEFSIDSSAGAGTHVRIGIPPEPAVTERREPNAEHEHGCEQ